MDKVTWDPLAAKPAEELLNTTVKLQIKNILKSYTGWFDPFSELLQNALDALESRKEKGREFTPTVWVDINLKENTISVTDNGIGFSEEQFKNFLAPNVSFKRPEDRGNKGVGATYLGYGFNFLQIGTKAPDYSFIGTIKGGREWVEEENQAERPKVIQDSEAIHNIFNEIERGSTFTLKLGGKDVRPSRLNWVGATKAKQWKAILQIKTALGGIYINKECHQYKVHLKVKDEQDRETTSEISNCEYLYPHMAISTCVELKEILNMQEEMVKKGKDVSRLPDKYYRLNGLYNFWGKNEFISTDGMFTPKVHAEQKELIKKYNISSYGFLCYTTDIWDQYNDTTLGIRKGERILRGGLQLATNSMPQGDLIMIPLTRNVYYQNVSHVIVHFEQADPDLGRKGFQPELVDLAKYISSLVVNAFLPWRKLLRKETGEPPDIAEKKRIHDWIRDLEAYEEKNPLRITRKDVFLPTTEPSITSKPLNESDVIALFNQLLAGGVIRGVRLMATSSHEQYDGVFRLCLKKPFEHFVFNKEKNPLGLDESMASEDYTSEPRILEYKYSFDALIEEIEKEIKNERDIKLVIAWEMGNKWQSRYEITPLLHFDNIQHRYFHGATHIIKNSQTGQEIFPAIILSELIEYINEPDSVQQYQSKTYLEI